ncbi:hypothetical protein Aca07nite_12160 [Actinoplanes capillaceus]|uniref:Uncharacterized protein n=1 Tax=Actinoplanes campanulatus TaxID=113559 RepID=A0ABQ3WDD6_9ACTN|nr:hypothetical protein Aca07nite_12160 [Actinoplanes capillaceus]
MAAPSSRARPLRIQVVAKMTARTARPVTRFRRQTRPPISTMTPTIPDSRLRATPAPVGRKAPMIWASPPKKSQMPVSATMIRREMSGQMSTVRPSAIASKPVISSVHQGNGCRRTSTIGSGQVCSTSVMG